MVRRKAELTLLMEVAFKWPWKVLATLVPVSYVACHLIVGHNAVAGTPVYKCVKDGQVTLTDKPCDSSQAPDPETSTNSPINVPSSKNPSPVGVWSGQIQYQEVQNGYLVQAAHSVVLLRADFTADGKVSGLSKENGCRLLGVWFEGGQTLVWIDITLSGCAYGDFNRQYHGSFILARPDSSGQVDAESFGMPGPFSKDVGKVFDIKGTLRR